MDGRVRAKSSDMTVRSHLLELRNRLFLVVGIFIIASGLAYWAYPTIFDILTAPLEGQKLSYLTVGGGLTFTFMVMIGCGLIVAMPFLLVSLYTFVSPALPNKAQSRAPFLLISSMFLTVAGALFGYFVAIPGAIDFLTDFAGENLTSVLTTDSYLNFILAYTVGLGLLFQLPLVLLMINWIKPLGPKKMLSFERFVAVGSFVAAAIITPTPDPVNQTIIALPVIAMYQIGFFAVLWVNWRERARLHKRAVKEVPTPEARTVDREPSVNFVTQRSPRPTPTRMVQADRRSASLSATKPRRSIDGVLMVPPRPSPRSGSMSRRPSDGPSTALVSYTNGRSRSAVFTVDGISRVRAGQY